MAEITSKGKGKALQVFNAATNSFIEIPLHNNESIMRPVVDLQTWIKARMRTGGKGDILPGGKVTYFAYPKQAEATRSIEIKVDDTTGKISGGMLGASSSATFGYIKPTAGQKIVKDEITFAEANFIKHVFSNQDLKTDGLTGIVNMFLEDNLAEQMEINLEKLKSEWAATFGTIGKWANDAGYKTLPTTGVGLRLRAKTYTSDAAGGKEAIADIKAVVSYKAKLGRKGGVEVAYPFARGMNTSTNTLVAISSSINDSMLAALEDSKNGFVAGVSINKDSNTIKSIIVDGKTIKVQILTDAPQKGGKDFNWSVEEVGRRGAIAMPNAFKKASKVRPHYEGNSLTHSILEMIGLVLGMKALQPELNWGSFEA